MKTKITTLLFLAICSLSLFSTNYVVNTNANSGAGSLRQAITDANADASVPHTITFDASYTITLGSSLSVSKVMTIDGGANTININGYSSSLNSLTNSAVLTLNNLIFNNFISSYSANATATNCTFKNTANAVKVNTSVTFSATNCIFDSNTGSSTLGASVTSASGSAVIQLSGCTITNNTGVPAVYHKGTSTGTLTLTNCTVSGNTSTTGPAIYNAGNGSGSLLSISNSIIKNNTNSSASVYGGGIGSGAVTTISNCQISGNTAVRGGGIALLAGGANAKSKLTMSGCTISENTITGTYGCGVYLQGVTSNYTDNCTITNCTISGNYTSVASSVGGGIEIGAGGNTSWTPTITLTNCSITGNWVQGNPTNSTNAGGGIDVAKGTAVVNYCIIAGNNSNSSSASKDLASATSTTGRNLYGGSPNWNSTTTTGNIATSGTITTWSGTISDIINTTLTDNGGTTALPDGSYVKTHALVAGCVAINPDATGVSGMPTTDQRLFSRDATPDMGAYERIVLATPTVGAPSTSATGFTANWSTVTNALSYDVKVYQDGSYVKTVNVANPAATSVSINGLQYNTTYTFTVTAIANNVSYFSSNESISSAPVTTDLGTKTANPTQNTSVRTNNKTIYLSEPGIIEVYNLQGCQLFKSGVTTMLVVDLPAGIYAIRVNLKNNSIQKQIIL
ncbi:MAG: right-handed parallel beta-helix repeat-containing protein [Paludibacter sp.]